MEVYVILYGNAERPELSDEIKGYLYSQIDAEKYCANANETAKEGWAYFWEVAEPLEA